MTYHLCDSSGSAERSHDTAAPNLRTEKRRHSGDWRNYAALLFGYVEMLAERLLTGPPSYETVGWERRWMTLVPASVM